MCMGRSLLRFFIILAFSNIIAFSSQQRVITVDIQKKSNSFDIYLLYSKSYGVQSGTLNHLELYQLDNKHKADISNVSSNYKVEKYGTLIQSVKEFKGIYSKIDKKYYEQLFPVIFSIKPTPYQTNYILKGQIFYCSFELGICSTQKIEEFI